MCLFLYFVGKNSFIHLNSKIHSVGSFGVCECNLLFFYSFTFRVCLLLGFVYISGVVYFVSKMADKQ
jgi:hypothetical protein